MACALVDRDAGNCDVAFGALTFGCGTEPEAEYDAGFYSFDDVQAQACLDAFAAATDCSAATQTAINTACANLLGPNVAVGGACINDANCIPPGPGVPTAGTWGCDTESGDNSVGCTWTCSYGRHLGEVCGSGASGSGCLEGNCVSVDFADGGSNLLCVAAAAEGEPCGSINQGGNGNTCADPNDFCNGITSTCTAMVPAFGGCDPNLCPGFNSCPCGAGTFCVADLDGGGACLPVVDGGDCDFDYFANFGVDSTPCGQLPNSRCAAPTDGGSIGSCQPWDGIGTACDPTECPLGFRCNCDPSLLCDPAGADGGDVCVAKHGVGGQCYPGQCFDAEDPSCRCDPSQALYCRSDQTCQLHVGDGGACGHSEIRQCDDGLACSNGLCVNASPTQLGAACAPNDGVWCQDGLTCTDFANGVCVQSGSLGDSCFVNALQPCELPLQCTASDGGAEGVCGPALGVGESCVGANRICNGLLFCDGLIFSDAGFGELCEPYGGLGDACDPGENRTCAVGLCDQSTARCIPQPGRGEACDPTERDACQDYSTCDIDPTSGAYTCISMCPEDG